MSCLLQPTMETYIVQKAAKVSSINNVYLNGTYPSWRNFVRKWPKYLMWLMFSSKMASFKYSSFAYLLLWKGVSVCQSAKNMQCIAANVMFLFWSLKHILKTYFIVSSTWGLCSPVMNPILLLSVHSKLSSTIDFQHAWDWAGNNVTAQNRHVCYHRDISHLGRLCKCKHGIAYTYNYVRTTAVYSDEWRKIFTKDFYTQI